MSDLVILGKKIREMEEREEPFCVDFILTLNSSDLKCPVSIPEGKLCNANLINAPTARIKIKKKDGRVCRTKILICPECYSEFFA